MDRMPRPEIGYQHLPHEPEDRWPLIWRLDVLPVLRDTRPFHSLHHDPLMEEIRLRVRWGWRDATAREGLPR